MVCVVIGDQAVHVNRPETCWVRTVQNCPVCRQRRRLVGFDQLWYGITWTCLGCGDQWSGGELLPRPFRPRWRQDSIVRAASHWPEAVRQSGPEHRQWAEQQMADYLGDPAHRGDR